MRFRARHQLTSGLQRLTHLWRKNSTRPKAQNTDGILWTSIENFPMRLATIDVDALRRANARHGLGLCGRTCRKMVGIQGGRLGGVLGDGPTRGWRCVGAACDGSVTRDSRMSPLPLRARGTGVPRDDVVWRAVPGMSGWRRARSRNDSDRSGQRASCRCYAEAGARRSCFVRTSSQETVTALMESGFFSASASCHLLVDLTVTSRTVLDAWRKLGSIGDVVMGVDGEGGVWKLSSDENGRDDMDEPWEAVFCGIYRSIGCAEDASRLIEDVRIHAKDHGDFYVMIDALDWKVIPVENFIAAFQGPEHANVKLVMACGGLEDARLMRDVMEMGTDGILVDLMDGGHGAGLGGGGELDARGWARFVREEYLGGLLHAVAYDVGVVTRVEQCGMGDRICVDLAENMVAGEGFLLGSFARGLFFVHSECEETSYINSRPFRVNAGPVHSYVELQDDRTGYLSELKSGCQVAVFDWHGNVRAATVGRIKQEKRPLVNVTAVGKESGKSYSVMLQNAETVKLVGPDGGGFRTVSVSVIKEGDEVFLLEHGESARHTGIAIHESISEY